MSLSYAAGTVTNVDMDVCAVFVTVPEVPIKLCLNVFKSLRERQIAFTNSYCESCSNILDVQVISCSGPED